MPKFTTGKNAVKNTKAKHEVFHVFYANWEHTHRTILV